MDEIESKLEDTLIDLSIIARQNQRTRLWCFWGGSIAMFSFALIFTLWPRLFVGLDFTDCAWLLAGAALTGSLLGFLLGSRGGHADSIYRAHVESLRTKPEAARLMERISEEAPRREYRALARQMLNEAKTTG